MAAANMSPLASIAVLTHSIHLVLQYNVTRPQLSKWHQKQHLKCHHKTILKSSHNTTLHVAIKQPSGWTAGGRSLLSRRYWARSPRRRRKAKHKRKLGIIVVRLVKVGLMGVLGVVKLTRR